MAGLGNRRGVGWATALAQKHSRQKSCTARAAPGFSAIVAGCMRSFKFLSRPSGLPTRQRPHEPRTRLADQQLHLPGRRRGGCAAGQKARPGLDHWLPGGRHRHRAVGTQAGHQCAGHPSLCRVRRGVDAVPDRPGAGAPAAVEPAPAHLWLGQRPVAELRRAAHRHRHGVRHRMAGRAGRRPGAGAVLDRDCAAIDQRAQPDAHLQRPSRLFDPAVSGRGGHSDPGTDAASGHAWRRK